MTVWRRLDKVSRAECVLHTKERWSSIGTSSAVVTETTVPFDEVYLIPHMGVIPNPVRAIGVSAGCDLRIWIKSPRVPDQAVRTG